MRLSKTLRILPLGLVYLVSDLGMTVQVCMIMWGYPRIGMFMPLDGITS